MKTRIYASALLAALAFSAMAPSCSTGLDYTTSPSSPSGEPVDDMAVYMLPVPQSVELTDQQKKFAKENNNFTLRFLRTVNDADQSDQSFIYSPLGITYVLGMVNDGAEGQTRQEIERVLGFGEGNAQTVNEYCQVLIESLPQVDENVQLNIANAIYVSKRYSLKSQFQEDMHQYYHAQAETLDFGSPASLNHINNWCNEQTGGMIPNILDKLNPDAVMYLLNAIYLKAGWASKFDISKTQEGTFTTEGGARLKLPLMQQTIVAQYAQDDLCAMVDLRYGSGRWTMTLMLPNEGRTTDEVIDSLASTGWAETYGRFMYRSLPMEVDLKIPRFKTTSDTDRQPNYDLIDLLEKMGIRQVFSPDFSQVPNICEDGNLFISLMRQKAAIEVNEDGAKAAAVTVAEAELTSVEPSEHPHVTFHANRPFVYLIREASSGVLLFVGKFTGK